MSHDDGTQDPGNIGSQGPLDDAGQGLKRERRKRYPGILSKLAAGTPEDAALAVLKGELDLPVPSVNAASETDDAGDEKP